MLVLVAWCITIWSVDSMVLDPALYLDPSPPLLPTKGDRLDQWAQSRTQRYADLQVIPIGQIKTPCDATASSESKKSPSTNTPYSTTSSTSNPATAPHITTTSESTTAPHTSTISELKTSTTTTTEQEMMEKSETFWPRIRPTASTGPYLGIQGIHVPLTFSLTGTYGRYGTGAGNAGVIGSSYASVDTEDSGIFKLYGKSGLAGSSYGSYGGYGGTRIYGSGGRPSWSGWGNGKWGHYGKG